MRNKCLKFSHVASVLGISKDDKDNADTDGGIGSLAALRGFASNNNPIGRDLEHRAKMQTIDRLRSQGNSYRDFNEKVNYLVEPELNKKQIMGVAKHYLLQREGPNASQEQLKNALEDNKLLL